MPQPRPDPAGVAQANECDRSASLPFGQLIFGLFRGFRLREDWLTPGEFGREHRSSPGRLLLGNREEDSKSLGIGVQ